MSTFLQLCQKVARESGTVSGTQPTAVTAQTGRLEKIVNWTADAWRYIQNSRSQWRWMQGEFTGSTVADTQRYTSTDLGIASRFGEWIVSGTDELRWSCYLSATGVSDESPLVFLEWDDFYATQLRGTQTSGKPRYFTVAPDNRICFSPTPDAIYKVRGLYQKSAQELSANGDTPEMPARFHDLIVWEALKALAAHDENAVQLSVWLNNARILRSDLERDQLPRMTICGPLA